MFRLTHSNSLPAKLHELSLIEEEKTFYLSNSCLCDQNSPVAKTFNTLTAFPFFVGPSFLHHRLRLRKRFFCVELTPLWVSSLNPSCLVQSPLSVQCIKTVQWLKHSTHSLHFLFLFFVGPSLCITD